MNSFYLEEASVPEWISNGLNIDFPPNQSNAENAALSSPSNLQHIPQEPRQTPNDIFSPDYQYPQVLQKSLAKSRYLEDRLTCKKKVEQVQWLQGNIYCAITASGCCVQLTSLFFERVECIYYDPIYDRKKQLLVKVSTQEEPGLIDLEDFEDNKKWIIFLEQVSRTQIGIYRSMKRTAEFLRSMANERMVKVYIPYLGGWNRVDDHYCYHTFRDFRTSARKKEPEQYKADYTELPANARASAERFLARFAPIRDGKLRSFCILWQHLSFLQTLLLARGIHLRKIPVVQAENPVVQAYLRSVLTVSADGILNMNSSSDDFLWSLISCKDQPCVILPPKFGKNVMSNEHILDEALSGSTITLKKGVACPLGTLPIQLATGEGQVFSYGIPLTAGAEVFDLPRCAEIVTEPTRPADYWSGFLAYTYQHMEKLDQLLKEQIMEALVRSKDCEYTTEHAEVLGAMWGVAEFLQLFARELSLSDNKILDDGWLAYTIALLEESDAQYAAPGGLAESFLAVGRRAICQKSFPCYRIGQQLSAIPRGAVFFNEDFVCLDRDVFERICYASGCNSAAVKRELAEQEYFTGKGVNRQSYQTRISLICKDGSGRMVRVYKFRRDAFEVPGEPDLFQEV